jgi:hypothetical protein
LSQPPPSRDASLKKMVDIVRIGHDTLLDEHRELQQAVLGIHNFQAVPSNREGGKVFQYQIENQPLIQKHEVILISATATFHPVVNAYKNELFKLEMQIPTEYDIEYEKNVNVPKEDDKPQSLKEKLGLGGKKKRVIGKDEPYQHGLPYLTEALTKIDRFERFQEMQSFGVALHEFTSYSGMIEYLGFHRTQFQFEIAPTILRMHKQYIDLILKEEKMGAIKIAGKLEDESFKTRLDEAKYG